MRLDVFGKNIAEKCDQGYVSICSQWKVHIVLSEVMSSVFSIQNQRGFSNLGGLYSLQLKTYTWWVSYKPVLDSIY